MDIRFVIDKSSQYWILLIVAMINVCNVEPARRTAKQLSTSAVNEAQFINKITLSMLLEMLEHMQSNFYYNKFVQQEQQYNLQDILCDLRKDQSTIHHYNTQ